MKKLLVLLSAVMALSCNAQKVSEKNVPEPVKSSLQKQHPDAKKVKWEKEENNYEASFEINETEYSVLIDASGNALETEVEISTETLPAKVKEYINQNYPGQKIKEAAKITDSKGAVTYEAEIKGKALIFDSNGNFIKEQKD